MTYDELADYCKEASKFQEQLKEVNTILSKYQEIIGGK